MQMHKYTNQMCSTKDHMLKKTDVLDVVREGELINTETSNFHFTSIMSKLFITAHCVGTNLAL